MRCAMCTPILTYARASTWATSSSIRSIRRSRSRRRSRRGRTEIQFERDGEKSGLDKFHVPEGELRDAARFLRGHHQSLRGRGHAPAGPERRVGIIQRAGGAPVRAAVLLGGCAGLHPTPYNGRESCDGVGASTPPTGAAWEETRDEE